LKPENPQYAQAKDDWRANMANWDSLKQGLVRNLDGMQYLEEQAQKGLGQGLWELAQRKTVGFDTMAHLSLFREVGLPKDVSIQYDEKGHVQDIKFPKDLKSSDFAEYSQWIDASRKQMDAAIKEVGLVEKDPNKAIAWGDVELHSV